MAKRTQFNFCSERGKKLPVGRDFSFFLGNELQLLLSEERMSYSALGPASSNLCHSRDSSRDRLALCSPRAITGAFPDKLHSVESKGTQFHRNTRHYNSSAVTAANLPHKHIGIFLGQLGTLTQLTRSAFKQIRLWCPLHHHYS